MIIVDTSVWVAAIRRPQSEAATTLKALLDADEVALALPVRVELMTGVSKRDRMAFARGLSSLPVARPSEETWDLIEGWIPAAADRGFHFAVTDLLIAGIAREIGALVWSLDEDFSQMAPLGFVQLYG